jgi:hypothetical protein
MDDFYMLPCGVVVLVSVIAFVGWLLDQKK